MVRIPIRLREQIIERALGRCEYCQTQQTIVVSMEIDHIVPESAEGKTVPENLCLACVGCNGFKQHFQVGTDPETAVETSLFNPRNQDWNGHFRWSNDKTQVIGLTAVGRATIVRLRMNRDLVVKSRRRWLVAGWHPPSETI